MIVRSALFVGTVAEERVQAFNTVVDGEVLPLLQGLPGVVKAEMHRPTEQEAGLPPIHQIYHLWFQDRAAMAGMLDSPERARVHDAMAAILPWFSGEVVHIVSETAD